MPSFTEEEMRENFYIWQMFRDGAVVRIHDLTVLNKLKTDLIDRGYKVRSVDCRLENERDLEDALRRLFQLDAGFGLDTFNSQLWHLQFPVCTGLVVILSNIDEFNKQHPKYLWNIVDILANHCRIRMLTGDRLLVMLHANDRNIALESVGGASPCHCALRQLPSDSGEANGEK